MKSKAAIGRKVYRGSRSRGTSIVLVDGVYLDPGRSQRLWQHAPDFDWGVPGPGAAQLALAILLNYTDMEELSLQLHNDFMFTFIVNTSKRSFQLNATEIDDFLNDHAIPLATS